MSGDYSYVVAENVVQVFNSSIRSEREELLRIFQSLAQSPFQHGEYAQTGPSGRVIQVKRLGKWQVSFWADHAVLELRIVRVRKLIV